MLLRGGSVMFVLLRGKNSNFEAKLPQKRGESPGRRKKREGKDFLTTAE